MIEIERETFLKDPVFKQIYEVVRRNHKVARHTEKELKKNKHIKDFCEESRCFAMLPGRDPIYLHYDIASWYKKPNGVQIKIERIAFYDNYLEYELSRTKQIYSASDSDDYRSN